MNFELIHKSTNTRGNRVYLHYLVKIGTKGITVVVPIAAWKFPLHFSKELGKVRLQFLQRLSLSEPQLEAIMKEFELHYSNDCADYYTKQNRK